MAPSQDTPPPSGFFTAPSRDMGIDALGRVTSEIVTEVQTLVGVATLPPGSSHADLLHSLFAAFGQGRAIIGGLMNAAAPIHRMPPELLAKIFILSPRAITHASKEHKLAHWPFRDEADMADLHKLTKVCRYWRELAIATPMLWTTVGTVSTRDDHRNSVLFHCSKYLPDSPSLGLTVHLDLQQSSTAKMVEFMLTHAPNVRELHVWDIASIPDVPSFWRSFDASNLEHCTFWSDDTLQFRNPQPQTNPELPFFNGGASLRSLCLADFSFHGFPPNAFPALTLLLVSASAESRVTMADLFKFLVGCPRLEELYIYGIQRGASLPASTSPPPISLPNLQYLHYTYRRRRTYGWKEGTDPIDHLLSSTSLPSTCHMYFSVLQSHRCAVTNREIFDSVHRNMQEKDAVSHVFLWLMSGSTKSVMQLVFPQGSLRLQSGTHFDCVETLDTLPRRLFSGTEDVRVCYTSPEGYTDLVRRLRRTLSSTFPELKVLLLARLNPWTRGWPQSAESGPDAPVHLLHQYLMQPWSPSSAPDPDSKADDITLPWHPELDTLWVSVWSEKQIVALQETLAGRAALGFPIRCVIVHHCFAACSPAAYARLWALDGAAEEVILMRTSSSRVLNEGDWAVRLPDRFSLPPAVRRDWPSVWYRR
ncbi:hypothetical protein V8D89_002901 [Ganoderma adspersum]